MVCDRVVVACRQSVVVATVTEAEINKLFKRFFAATKMSKNPALMKRKVFLRLPGTTRGVVCGFSLHPLYQAPRHGQRYRSTH